MTSVLFSPPSSIMKDTWGVSGLAEIQSNSSAKVHGWFHFEDVFQS